MYWFLKVSMETPMRLFFKKIYINGKENIPKDCPIILSSNHPNSFLDGVILNKTMHQMVYILVRGDVFAKPLANKILRSMCLRPIFRARDTKNREEQIKNNEKTFNECVEILKKKRIITIFSEAVAKCEKRLRPIKKGTARIAFESSFDKEKINNVKIVPTGITYQNFGRWRKNVYINFGKPIDVIDYKKAYEENDYNTIANLSEHLGYRIKELIVNINEPKNDDKADTLLNLLETHTNRQVWFKNRNKQNFNVLQKLANSINNDKLFGADIYQLIKKNNINSEYIETNRQYFIWKVLKLIVFLPLVLIGFFINAFVIYPSNYITKSKVKETKHINVFYDSILYSVGLVFSHLLTFLLIILFTIIYGWYGFFIAQGLRYCGILSLRWVEWLKNCKEYLNTSKENRELIKSFIDNNS